MLNRAQLVERLKTIKLLALDVDGVLTDNSLYLGPDGLELKRFNIADGFYMKLAMRAGLPIVIISGRYSAATDTRMTELGIKYVFQGKADKPSQIEPLLKELGIDYRDVAYVGDELLDISIGERVGLPIAVHDAASGYKQIVAYVTEHKGGKGAVRELLECWFEAIGKNPREFVY
jgi:3-deoxy-D-manno-octulosonate 8-phosphate phosphatase (KDO 8-P phosphatase)